MADIQLLFDPPASGAWNMARDEALLLHAAGTSSRWLRFYEWEEPTLSLGYFQASSDRAQHSASGGCPVVRRASGGGAILHDRELTYCFVDGTPQGTRQTPDALYGAFHQTLVATLAEYNVAARLVAADEARDADRFLCFQRRSPGDVVCHDAKLAGSAQRRQRGATLQHGSILLRSSSHAPELLGLAELGGRLPEPLELARRWCVGLSVRLGPLSVADTPPLDVTTQELVVTKFAHARWTHRR